MKLPDKLSARGYKEKDSKRAEDIKIKRCYMENRL